MERTGAAVTFRVAVPLADPVEKSNEAVIVTMPGAMPVTMPLLTFATVVSDEDQVASVVMSVLVPRAEPVALNENVPAT
jgi:hypothetical protein